VAVVPNGLGVIPHQEIKKKVTNVKLFKFQSWKRTAAVAADMTTRI
jgi:hypothetical protein